jgi:PAS domain S-box-containing protein
MIKKKQTAKKEVVGAGAGISGGKRAEEAPDQDGMKYRALFEAIADATFLIDQQTGNILDVNSAAMRIYGFTHEEFVKLKNTDVSAEIEETTRATQEIMPLIPVRYHKRKDGSVFPVEITANTCEIEGRTVIICTVRDITERKQAEAALKESEERYQRITEGLTDYLYTVRLQNGRVVETSHGQACKKVTGYTKKEFADNPNLWMNMVVEEERDMVRKRIQRILAGENIPPIEHRIMRKDGQIRWVSDTPILQFDSENRLVSYDGMIKDITEHKRAEETLAREKLFIESLLATAQTIILVLDTSGHIVTFNPYMEHVSGYKLEEVKGKEWFSTFLPEDKQAKTRYLFLKAIGDIQTKGNIDEIITRDGKIRIIEWYDKTLKDDNGNIVGLLSNGQDITERKQREKENTDMRILLQASIESPKDMIIMAIDQDYRYLCFNDVHRSAMKSAYGKDVEIGMNVLDCITSDNDRLNAKANYDRAMSGESHSTLQEYGHLEKVYYESFYNPILNSRNEIIGITAFARDITERKKADEALRESDEKYRLVVENAQEAIFIEAGGTFKFANSQATILTGYSQEELTSRPFTEFIHPDDRQLVVERGDRRLTGLEESGPYTFRAIVKSGDTRWVELSAVLITWEGRPATLNFLTDITDRKRLEEERQRVDKLESVGMLAGGIAHDFNNILTSILGNISLARTEAAPGSELLDSLEQAEKASQRAKALTLQLLTFSRGGAPVTKLASLTELIKDTAGFALSGSNVKCRFSIPVELWHAEIDAGQVSQVIHNLVINAQQAMPTGGSIEIRAENIALSEMPSLGRGLPLKSGDYIRIAVADHGTGIPGDHLEKIFDPFFTTKQKGNGMGLAISFSIARQHSGHLSVESELGTGSTFYLYLPASVQTSAPKEDKKEAMKPAGKARILVMDDEKGVREIAGRMLRHIGYKDIEFAKDGAEAIKLYKAAMQSGNPFSVAILDLTIAGGMGGEVAIKKLLKIDPGVKAIVSSGYIDDPVMAKHIDHGFSGVVAKPYTIEELRKAVQDVIR